MSYWNISFSLWYIKHRTLIDLVAIIFLLVINFLIGLYLFYEGVRYLASPIPGEPDILVKRGQEIQDLEVIRAEAVPNQNIYDLVAEIKNPNERLGLGELGYKFILLGTQDEAVAFVAGVSYILPGETKYIIRTGIDTKGKKVRRVELKLSPKIWLKKGALDLSELKLYKDSPLLSLNAAEQLELFAIVQNQTGYSFKTVEINAVCLGANNSILGVNYTTLNNLYTETKREFRVRWPEDFRSGLEKTVIEIKTNTYDGANFVEKEREGEEGPSEYRDI